MLMQWKAVKSLACLLCLVTLAALPASLSAASVLHSYAIVQEDASLLVRGKTVHLLGVYIPPTDRFCRSNIRPVRCASRAVLALDFKVQGFVHCYPQSKNADGSLQAVCYVNRTAFDDGEDLAAYLIREGWALAGPDAPFEYIALERIARRHNKGVWGFQVDEMR